MSEFYSVPHIDWLALTVKVEGYPSQKATADNLIFLLGGASAWRLSRGMNGYEHSYRHPSGAVVLFGASSEMGVHLSLPSQALAYFSDYMDEVLDGWDWEASRIDIAVDTNDVSVDFFVENPGVIVSKAKHKTLVTDLTSGGKTLYLGSARSGRKLVRIYDKGSQVGEDVVWTRVEVQLRKEFARAAFRALRNGVSLVDILKRSIDFREPGDGDVYRRRRLPFWEACVGSGHSCFRFPSRLKLDDSVERLARWVEKYMSAPLAKCRVALGESWLRSVFYRGYSSIDVRYYAACGVGST